MKEFRKEVLQNGDPCKQRFLFFKGNVSTVIFFWIVILDCEILPGIVRKVLTNKIEVNDNETY